MVEHTFFFQHVASFTKSPRKFFRFWQSQEDAIITHMCCQNAQLFSKDLCKPPSEILILVNCYIYCSCCCCLKCNYSSCLNVYHDFVTHVVYHTFSMKKWRHALNISIIIGNLGYLPTPIGLIFTRAQVDSHNLLDDCIHVENYRAPVITIGIVHRLFSSINLIVWLLKQYIPWA